MDNNNKPLNPTEAQQLLGEIDRLHNSKLGRLFAEGMEILAQESKDLGDQPCKMEDILEREQFKGCERAFKRAAGYFRELAVELNQYIKEEEDE